MNKCFLHLFRFSFLLGFFIIVQVYSAESNSARNKVQPTKALHSIVRVFYPTKRKIIACLAVLAAYLMSNKMLDWSIERESRTLALLSLLCGANPSQNNDDYARGRNYVYKAISCGQLSIARLLLARGGKLSRDDKSSLIKHAAEYRNNEKVRFLLDNGVDLNDALRGNWWSWESSVNSHFLEWVIENDPQRKREIFEGNYLNDIRRVSAFFDFAKRGSLTALDVMLSHGVCPNVRDNEGKSALEIASTEGRGAIIDRLLQTKSFSGVEISRSFAKAIQNYKPYREASQTIRAFVAHGFDINGRDERGIPFLQCAIELNKPGLISEFFSCGVSTDFVDCKGRTPLIYAIHKYLYGVARVLVKRCPIDAQDNFGRTALIEAIRPRRKRRRDSYDWHWTEEFARYLVTQGTPDITKRAMSGSTALSLAYASGRYDLFHFLAAKIVKEMYDRNTGRCPCCLESPQELGLQNCTVMPCCANFICSKDFSEIMNVKKYGRDQHGKLIQFSQCPLCKVTYC